MRNVFLLTLLTSLASGTPLARGSCGEFTEGACDLSETNIVDHNRFTNTPGECQDQCSANSACHWFTHFSTQCYLLVECGQSAHCSGCVNGPTTPDFDSCPWPPSPTNAPTTPTTTTPPTTTPAPTTTTTPPTTPAPTTTTTTPPPTTTTTTTPAPTTTTSSLGECEDIHINSQCDWDYGLITWYERVFTGSECQHLCRNVNGAKFFSSYAEGHEAEHGYCGCFSSCAWPATGACHDRCSTHETHSIEDLFSEELTEDLDSGELFGGEVGVAPLESGQYGPGPRWCHCMRGGLYPDADTCDLFP